MPKFPQKEDLPDDPKVMNKYREAKEAENRLDQRLYELRQITLVVQKKCPHVSMENITSFDRSYHWGGDRGDTVLVGKKCPVCKVVKNRPEGSPWVVCHKCWGKMKYTGIIPGQGGRTTCYECEKCGHEVQTT